MWQNELINIEFPFTHTKASKYCTQLTLKEYNDWSLPTVNQFMTILDFSKEPVIKKEFNSSSNNSWNAHIYHTKEYEDITSWVISILEGRIYPVTRYKSTAYMRCVRKIK